MKDLIKPNTLKRGDTIGFVSTSSPMAGLVNHRVKAAVKMIEELGFNVKIGNNALKVNSYIAGTGRERAEDINTFFRNNEIKAIISFIGGNHSNQTLEYLDFELIKNHPKILMGYSDTTVLELAILSQTGLVTFYGPSALNQFAENPKMLSYTEEYFKKAVMSNQPIGKVSPSLKWTDEILDWFKKDDQKRARKMRKNNGWQWLFEGKAEGPIMGGCITSMMHLRGTKYWPDFFGSILFWEIPESSNDFTKGKKPEDIDACLTDLELSGVFKQIKGMIIGRPFGYSKKQIEELIKIIKTHTKDYKFLVLFGVDIGHTDPMITLPQGVRVLIDSSKNIFEFVEKGTK
ncbi:MAG: hypothetical protein US31_C0003G0015 [Berkelbacteria bacterium GW2011_GWA1_36_9]|uniref:Peptidase U61 LD-carboxypeptidase A n=1 Tax=Berkelbacteria bacterium GW2011_GWA1_36_9 TaxID=1618331 RepID=A0A0G0IRG2_9BACT|nr:MAG: hypothetical protein US31_C0003G0015 [Berkelbacteria bacterium GW2011_GWA1_36_9]